MLVNNLEASFNKLEKEYSSIPEKRKELLNSLAKYISTKIADNAEVNLIFICTHNSRRSTMSQIWAQTAAEYFGISNVKCYSGGTEATAFNPRAVKAVREVGFKVEQMDETDNPLYLVYYSKNREPIKCFSKVYRDSFNPLTNFAAIITCSDADANCPVVFGAEERFAITYDDPKEFDNTEFEENKYYNRFKQIGTEMFYIFSKIVY